MPIIQWTLVRFHWIELSVILVLLPGEEYYNQMLKSMMEKVNMRVGHSSHFTWRCTECQREYPPTQATNLKNHIEAKHVHGFSFTCNLCGGVLSNKASLRTHNRLYHKGITDIQYTVTAQSGPQNF